jgi:hypothetical protein
MISGFFQTVRSAFKSRGVLAMALCGIVAVLCGSLHLFGGHPAFAALSLALFTLMAVMAVSQLVSLRWLHETEARKSHTRFRDIREAAGKRPTAAQQVPAPVAKPGRKAAAPAAPAAAPAAPARRAVGRLAAAVEEDRHRQTRILGYLGVPPAAAFGGRRIYSIVGKELHRYLGDTHELESLRPSTIGAQIASGSGSAVVVVDDSAFISGTWFGADSAAGTLLANEILRALAECRSQGMPVYFVRTRPESDIYTPAFEAAADVVFSDGPSLDEWTEDYTFGLLASLQTFAKMTKGELIGSH